jgi:hypothetical protein
VTSPDPLKQLDPKNPSSHLSHILIPRVRRSIRMFTTYTEFMPRKF